MTFTTYQVDGCRCLVARINGTMRVVKPCRYDAPREFMTHPLVTPYGIMTAVHAAGDIGYRVELADGTELYTWHVNLAYKLVCEGAVSAHDRGAFDTPEVWQAAYVDHASPYNMWRRVGG